MAEGNRQLTQDSEDRFWSGVADAGRFFMGDADVQRALVKLASGMSAPHRLRDLADVLELIRVSHLPAELAEQLDPSVRKKYRELWDAAQAAEPHLVAGLAA